MFENATTADDRGQVGIETLIIFIAMILVAAIAAGILINTAGFLQNKASATGEESTNRVTNHVQVVSAHGDVGPNGRNVTTLNMTVMPAPGAKEIDLSDASLEYIGPHGHEILEINGTVIGPNLPPPCVFTGDCVGVSPILPDPGGPILDNDVERLQLVLELQPGDGVQSYLHEGQQATIRITTASGGTTTCVTRIPESISSSTDGGIGVGC